MKVIGQIVVAMSLALPLDAQIGQPVTLKPDDVAPVRISADAAPSRPCGSPSRLKENEKLSRKESICGPQFYPQYPLEARKQRIQGTVHIGVLIGKDGLIKEAHIIDGHPMLTASALEAVKGWRYQPYRLKGKILEVETIITVNYTISDSER